MLILGVAGNASAHGVVGNRVFIAPIVGKDAFPDNALDLTLRLSNYAFSLLPELEKQLSDNSSVLTIAGWNRIDSGARQLAVSGWSDVAVFLRHAVIKSAPHELEFHPESVCDFAGRQSADPR